MNQEITVNVDEIVMRKNRQDREQANDLDTLVKVIVMLKQEVSNLQAKLQKQDEVPAKED